MDKSESRFIELENKDWLEALDGVFAKEGPQRVQGLLRQLQVRSQRYGVRCEHPGSTAYINTIAADEQGPYPGNREVERRIKSIIRWNAMAMVVRANRICNGIGGHISTYASSATLLEVGFNHFFRARNQQQDGDLIYFQGHGSPGLGGHLLFGG